MKVFLALIGGIVAGSVTTLSFQALQKNSVTSFECEYPFPEDNPIIPIIPNSHRSSPISYYAIDFPLPLETPVLAAKAGIVNFIKDDSDEYGTEKHYVPKTNRVLIVHEDSMMTEYAHLAKGSVTVKVGDIVSAGDIIAKTGNSGFMTSPHLHFNAVKNHKNGKQYSVPIKFNPRS